MRLSTSGGSQQLPWPNSDPQCKTAEPLMVDHHGRPRWFTSTELKRRATNRVAPEPPYIRGKSIVVVNVLVNTEGRVVCARAVKGHPILRLAAERAATKWSFRPMKSKRTVLAVIGQLSFTFSYDRVTY